PPAFNISPDNQFAVQQVVKLFLCPSDRMEPLGGGYGVPQLGPTNYAACLGTGTTNGGPPYGSPRGAGGILQAPLTVRVVDIADGTSNTAMMSESLLGDGPEGATGPIPGDPRLVYAYLNLGTALSESACAAANRWNLDRRRGFLWATGEI